MTLWTPRPKTLWKPLWMNKFSPGSECTCCGGVVSCVLLHDDFNRANSTSLGSLWNEVIGDWEIISNTLRVTTSGSNGVLVTASAPTQQNYKISTQINNLSANDKIRLIFGYTNSANYYFAELLFSTSGYIRIYQKSGGVDTQLNTTTTFNSSLGISTADFSLCYNATSGVLTATHENTLNQVSTFVATPASTAKAGIAVANAMTTSDAQFAFVTIEKVEAGCETCGPGNCCDINTSSPFDLRCLFDNDGPPLTVELDISGIVNAVSCTLCTVANDVFIATHRAITDIQCFPFGSGCADYIYEGFFDHPGSACASDPTFKWCHYELTASIAWYDISAWEYRVFVNYRVYYNSAFPGPTPSCASQPCGNHSTSNFGLARFDSGPLSVPVGGINSATMPPVTSWTITCPSGPTYCDVSSAACTFTVLS